MYIFLSSQSDTNICSLLQYDKHFSKVLLHLTKFYFESHEKKRRKKSGICLYCLHRRKWIFFLFPFFVTATSPFIPSFYFSLCLCRETKKWRWCYDLVFNFHCWINTHSTFAEFFENFIALFWNIFYAWNK